MRRLHVFEKTKSPRLAKIAHRGYHMPSNGLEEGQAGFVTLLLRLY